MYPPVPMATKKPRVGVFALGLVLWMRIEAARTPPMPPTTTGQYRKTCGMVKMARQGDLLYAFDIDCAFLHANLIKEEQINTLLPMEWREQNGRGQPDRTGG